MKHVYLLAAAALAALVSAPAAAQDRYGSRPPLTVSPDLAAPWVMQLRRAPDGAAAQQRLAGRQMSGMVLRPAPEPAVRRKVRAQELGRELRGATLSQRLEQERPRRPQAQADRQIHTAAVAAAAPREAPKPQMDEKFLPQQVDYDGPHKAGTIVVDTANKFLYLVQEGGQARRYGVGVGKEGMMWSGTENITRKAEWPDWRPPAEMIAREKKKGRVLPAHMEGGPANPLGARALYLGSTLYRIHGTNAPWTIGQNVSSGCIRLRNEDVMDLYDRVKVGAKVVVL
jgi:lipoprotein-anchoring transpeptidase ErfK/SrfK